MTLKRISFSLMACALLLGAQMTQAATPGPEKVAEVAERTPGAATKPASPKTTATSKAKAKVKPVDINGASKAALMKLPGVTDTVADKIMAGRPYGSKTWLLSNKVIDEKTFYAIKPLIEAKQPFKTAEENAAFYEKLKMERKAKP